jgi:hypothetical protein
MNDKHSHFEAEMERIRNSDPWQEFYDRRFDQLDTKGLPTLNEAELKDLEAKADPFEQADPFGTGERAIKVGLKQFLEGVESGEDDEAIADAARLPDANPNVKAEFADIRRTKEGNKFRELSHGRYLPTDQNLSTLVQCMAENSLGYSDASEIDTDIAFVPSSLLYTHSEGSVWECPPGSFELRFLRNLSP